MRKPMKCRCGRGLRFGKPVKKLKFYTKKSRSKRGRGMYLRPYRNFP